jgi:uncharacterized membrane protein
MISILNLVPVNVFKIWMRTYVDSIVSLAILKSTQTLFWISLQQRREEKLCWLFKIWFHWNLYMNDASQHFVSIFVIVWRSSRQHFVEKSTQAPPIALHGVAFSIDDFWCQVLRSSTKGMRLGLVAEACLGEAEIGDAYVSSKIKQDIFRLKITVDDTLFVKIS